MTTAALRRSQLPPLEVSVDDSEAFAAAPAEPAPSSSASLPSLNFRSQILASTLGSVAATLITSPFDVVKVRVQASSSHAGSMQAFANIVRHEGPLALWRGVGPGLVMTVPSSALYLSSYEYLKAAIASTGFALGPMQPPVASAFLAGALARGGIASVFVPLELVRTSMQAHVGAARAPTMIESFRLVAGPGMQNWRRLWTGMGVSLLRDIPFSAVYWGAYETLRGPLSLKDGSSFLQSFLAGGGAGMLAAAVTNPADVVKTRVQVHAAERRLRAWDISRDIMANEGLRGFTRGMAARITRVTPACAVVISTYEAFKRALAEDGA
eukprot:tig00020553_g10768.t1